LEKKKWFMMFGHSIAQLVFGHLGTSSARHVIEQPISLKQELLLVGLARPWNVYVRLSSSENSIFYKPGGFWQVFVCEHHGGT
jgi:hypothetical protein